MNFYIASGLSNWQQVQYVSESLEKEGLINIHNWAKPGITNLGLTKDILGNISHEQMQAIIKSDIIIVLLTMGRGTHMELGAAIALCELGYDKKILLYNKDDYYFNVDENTAGSYHNKHITKVTGDIDELINKIITEKKVKGI